MPVINIPIKRYFLSVINFFILYHIHTLNLALSLGKIFDNLWTICSASQNRVYLLPISYRDPVNSLSSQLGVKICSTRHLDAWQMFCYLLTKSLDICSFYQNFAWVWKICDPFSYFRQISINFEIIEKNQSALWVIGPRWTQLQLDLRKKCQYKTP